MVNPMVSNYHFPVEHVSFLFEIIHLQIMRMEKITRRVQIPRKRGFNIHKRNGL